MLFLRLPSSYLDHGVFVQIPIFINLFLPMSIFYKCQDIHPIPGHSLSDMSSTFYEPKLRIVMFSVVSGMVIISISDSKLQIFTSIYNNTKYRSHLHVTLQSQILMIKFCTQSASRSNNYQ